MTRRVLALGLAFGLAFSGTEVLAQAPSDPEVAKGIGQVEQGDYDAAIFTLDAAVRRLSADPKKNRELSEAYLYLGVAFLGKGHEAAAKAKFKEAVKQLRDLSLSPDKFAPRVIDLVEAAKAEAGPPGAARPAAAPAKQGGGSKKLLIFGGLGVVAAGGAVLALKGGGGDGGSCTEVFLERAGVLVQPAQVGVELPAGPAQAGDWTAEVTWNGTAPLPNVDLFVNVEPSQDTVAVGDFVSVSPTQARRAAHWQGAAGGRYLIKIFLDEQATTPVNFNLIVDGPCL